MGAGLARYGRTCPKCGKVWQAKRSDAVLCSGKCRMRMLRECNAITAAGQRDNAQRIAEEIAARDAEASAAADAKAAAKAAAAKAQRKNGKPKKKVKVAARRTTVTRKATKGRAK